MDNFDFPYHTYSTKYPQNGTAVQLGGNYLFTAPPAGPDLRVITLTFPAMVYYPITPLMPEYLNSDKFTASASGSPTSVTSLSPLINVNGYPFPVYDSTTTFIVNSKNVLPPTTGKVWRVEVEFKVVKIHSGDTPSLKVGVRALDNGYNNLSTVIGTTVSPTNAGTYVLTTWFSDTASGNIVAWPGTATWLRFFGQVSGTLTTGTEIQFRRMTVVDDTVPSDSNVDLVTNPQYNMAVLEKFYKDHKTYKTFTYYHPIYGQMKVKFNSPLQIPEGTKGGAGIVEGVKVDLIEVLA